MSLFRRHRHRHRHRHRQVRHLRLEFLESRTVMHGTGIITGAVFFDADANGLRDPGEVGLPGVVVHLSAEDAANSDANRQVFTDDDGVFIFDELEAGIYQVGKRQPPATIANTPAPNAGEVTKSVTLADDQTHSDTNFAESALRAEFTSIAWFFASSKPTAVLLRETVARSEELAGDMELAASIRAEATPPVVENHAPLVFDDVYASNAGIALVVPAANGLLVNDRDADSDALTAVLVTQPEHGSVVLNTDGSFTYTPASDFTGTDSFTYQATDGAANSSIATVRLNIVPVGSTGNQPPVAADDHYTMVGDTTLTIATGEGVLSNDVDPEGTSVSATLVTQPSSGSVSFNANGSFTYVPTLGFTGEDSFTYQATDGSNASLAATVRITVTAPTVANRVPVAENDSYVADQDTPLNSTVGVLANDTDADNDSLTATLVAQPQHGTVALTLAGTFTYTPTPGYQGPDSFTYRANDGTASSNVGTVSITVNAAPVGGLFAEAVAGSFEDAGLLGIRTDQVAGAPAIERDHVDGDVDYTGYSNPPTYGNHHGLDLAGTDVNPGITPRPTGIYTTEQPEEDLIHNMEHGHVWISYNPNLISDTERAALEKLVLDGSPNANGSGVGVILTPRTANDSKIALASWARLLKLNAFDAATIRNFVETNRGKAPEGFITP